MARKAVAKSARRRGAADKGYKIATVTVIAGILVAAVALPLCILLIVGLAPTIVAVLIDRHRRRYLARAVGATNLAGMVVPVIQFLHIGMSLAGAQAVLGDPRYWLIMYGAAAIGWLLSFSMPSVARIYVDIRADRLQQQLQGRAKELVKEWGEEVTGRSDR